MESQQTTIDALNARTAAYDVEIERLNGVVAKLRHDLVAAQEESATALAKAEKQRVEDLAKLRHEADEVIGLLKSQAVTYENRWKAQNTYIAVLESQASGEVQQAIASSRRAELAADIATLQARYHG